MVTEMKGMHWDLETRYKILLKINNAVISNPQKNSFFNAFINELGRHIKFDGATIHLYDQKHQSMRLYASSGHVVENIIGAENRPISMGYFAQKVVLSKKPIIIKDLAPYREYFPVADLMKIGIRATLAFPLIMHDRVLGSLHFLFRNVPEYISELSEMLTEISHQVAIAMNVIAAYNSLREENENLINERDYLLEQSNETNQEELIYISPGMKNIISVIKQVADTDAAILITGETGTGKDLIARHIHSSSARRNKLFVKVNCPALTASLFESELFGHAKGAFTGAESRRIGRFEMASGGTLFLDEISELPMALQAKLLQVLQENRFERVGESRSIEVNTRIVAATNEDLTQKIVAQQFRKDLFYRLNVINIHVPALRDRQEDIPVLVNYINERKSGEIRAMPPHYTPEAMDLLMTHDWPGNVRELRNLVMRILFLHAGQEITDEHISTLMWAQGRDISTVKISNTSGKLSTLMEAEYEHIKEALIKCRGVVGGANGAAAMLGMPRSTLKYRLKKHGLRALDYRL